MAVISLEAAALLAALVMEAVAVLMVVLWAVAAPSVVLVAEEGGSMEGMAALGVWTQVAEAAVAEKPQPTLTFCPPRAWSEATHPRPCCPAAR